MFKRAYILFTLLAAIVLFGCSNNSEQAEAKPTENARTVQTSGSESQPYDFVLTDLNGKVQRLADYRGKVVIVDIWDTWCPPCKAEIPHFIELHNEYKDKGFVMLGIAAGRYGVDAVRQFVKEHNIPYANMIGNPDIYSKFGEIRGIPTTFIINKKGEIANKAVGFRPKEFFEAEIKRLLDEA